MNAEEAFARLGLAAKFTPVALFACCAAELTRIKDREEQKAALRLISALALIASE